MRTDAFDPSDKIKECSAPILFATITFFPSPIINLALPSPISSGEISLLSSSAAMSLYLTIGPAIS